MKPVFEITFKCGNCANEWTLQYEKGDVVDRKYDGVYVNDHRCTHEFGCRFCHTITCPVCDDDKAVSIMARQPLVPGVKLSPETPPSVK